MRDLVQAHGPQAHGALLLLLAVPCLLPVPGAGTALGGGIAWLAFMMWRGHGTPDLPPRVAELELSQRWARRVMAGLAWVYALAGRHARERFSPMAGPRWQGVIALTVGLMAAIIVLPIPFGNLLPALAVMLIGIGLVFRDGVVISLGLLGACLTCGVTAGLVWMAWGWGTEWLPGQLGL